MSYIKYFKLDTLILLDVQRDRRITPQMLSGRNMQVAAYDQKH